MDYYPHISFCDMKYFSNSRLGKSDTKKTDNALTLRFYSEQLDWFPAGFILRWVAPSPLSRLFKPALAFLFRRKTV